MYSVLSTIIKRKYFGHLMYSGHHIYSIVTFQAFDQRMSAYLICTKHGHEDIFRVTLLAHQIDRNKYTLLHYM